MTDEERDRLIRIEAQIACLPNFDPTAAWLAGVLRCEVARADAAERERDAARVEAAVLRKALLPLHGILRHKVISPPMLPDVQERLEKQVREALNGEAEE